jgi:hypothetical protein
MIVLSPEFLVPGCRERGRRYRREEGSWRELIGPFGLSCFRIVNPIKPEKPNGPEEPDNPEEPDELNNPTRPEKPD